MAKKITLKENNEYKKRRGELHKKIWEIEEYMHRWERKENFKHYMLGFLFYNFISEDIANFFNDSEHESGGRSFDYALISDADATLNFLDGTVKSKGFFILPSQLFSNVQKSALTNENLSADLAKIFNEIETSAKGNFHELNIEGIFEETNDALKRMGKTTKERNNHIAIIMEKIKDLKFEDFGEYKMDAFGDACDFLISKYAFLAGSREVEFFTPETVSILLARLVMDGKTKINKIYDPACGSGGLLIQTKKYLEDHIIQDGFFGQEKSEQNYNLARINMFLHNINYSKFDIRNGDVLLNPMHKNEETFDAIVSNPPHSIEWEGDGNSKLVFDERFTDAGVLAPRSKADFAFIMHILSSLSKNGRAAIACFPGVLYRLGAEQVIRKHLVNNNFIDTVITLPGNLFFGTTTETVILILAKNKTTNDTLFINASKEFQKDKNTNILNGANIEKIVAGFRDRKQQGRFSRMVPLEELQENEYNLDVSLYIK